MTSKPSSCVTEYEYDKTKHTLTVHYINTSTTSTYDYDNVPESVFVGLTQAESKGKYLAANVKGLYSYTKRK